MFLSLQYAVKRKARVLGGWPASGVAASSHPATRRWPALASVRISRSWVQTPGASDVRSVHRLLEGQPRGPVGYGWGLRAVLTSAESATSPTTTVRGRDECPHGRTQPTHHLYGLWWSPCNHHRALCLRCWCSLKTTVHRVF